MTLILKWDFAGRKRRILALLDEAKFEGAGPALADVNMRNEAPTIRRKSPTPASA